MAQQFLDQLPRIQDGVLPDHAECMICREKYGAFPSDNGVVEHAVLLPCSHHVGSECIAIWLSPATRIGNSCPLCRKVLFQPQNEYYDYEDSDDDEDGDHDEEGSGDEENENEGNDEEDDHESDKGGENDEEGDGAEEEEEEEDRADGNEQAPMTVQSAFQRLATCFYLWPPTRAELEGYDGQEWFERWPIPTAQQFENSKERARQTLLRTQPSGSLYATPEIDSPPADLESKVKELASAYRTMAFRETLLYLKLVEAGARIRPLNSPQRGSLLKKKKCYLRSWANEALSSIRMSDQDIWR